jgi:uncharacterized protein YndB with AHSA1/START domain
MTRAELSTQVYEVVIKAAADTIWAAITTPDRTSRYFHGARIEATPTRYVSHGPDGSVWGDGPVFEWDPPRRLVHEWRSLYDPELAEEPASRVTWEIEPQGDGTCRVRITHDHLDGSPRTAQSVSGPGWTGVATALKGWVESGAAVS